MKKLFFIIFILIFLFHLTLPHIYAEKFKVVSVFPKDGAKNVEYNTNIMLEFNHPVDARTLTPYSILINSRPVSELYPEITRIPMLDYYRFVLPIPLEYGKKYTIQLTSKIKDDYGNNLEPFQFSFTTVNKEKLKVVSSNYKISEENGNRILLLQVKFNRSVDLRRRHIRVYHKTTEVDTWTSDQENNISDSIVIKIPMLSELEWYTVVISTTICDISGEYLMKPFVWKYKR